MGRPRLLNIQTALDETLALFLKRGYANTSLQAIADRLGAKRSTVYATLGDRGALFKQALQRYIETGRVPRLNDGHRRGMRCCRRSRRRSTTRAASTTTTIS